eukprot:gene36784-6792_t
MKVSGYTGGASSVNGVYLPLPGGHNGRPAWKKGEDRIVFYCSGLEERVLHPALSVLFAANPNSAVARALHIAGAGNTSGVGIPDEQRVALHRGAEVGDAVRLTGAEFGCMMKGEMGTVVEIDDSSDCPYRVKGPRGAFFWYRRNRVALTIREKERDEDRT